jgi:hypothetical protein
MRAISFFILLLEKNSFITGIKFMSGIALLSRLVRFIDGKNNNPIREIS